MGGVVGECVNSCTVQLSITNWRKESRMLFAVNYDESIYSRVFGVVASVQKKVSIKGRWKNARHIYIYTYSKNPAHELPWVFHGFREKVSLCFKKKKLDDGNQLHNIKKIN